MIAVGCVKLNTALENWSLYRFLLQHSAYGFMDCVVYLDTQYKTPRAVRTKPA